MSEPKKRKSGSIRQLTYRGCGLQWKSFTGSNMFNQIAKVVERTCVVVFANIALHKRPVTMVSVWPARSVK